MTNTSTTSSTTSTEKLLSACAGALVTSLLVTPLDVIKLRIQTQQKQTTAKASTLCCQLSNSVSRSREIPYCSFLKNINHTSILRSTTSKQQIANLHECIHGHYQHPLVLKGTLDGLYKIVRHEGIPALWKGLSPALVMSVPANVIYFVGYDHLRDFIRPYTSTTKDYSPLVAGGIARTIAVAVISPIELFRTRLQAATGVNDFRHVLQGVIKMVEKSGPTSLWRGLPPTLYRDVPFSAIYWMGYEETKQILLSYDNDMNGLQASFLAGAFSGMIAAGLTTPFDVAKTKRQVDGGRGELKDIRVPAILQQIYRQEGIHGLFRGLSARLAKVAPSCAIMIYFYEFGKSFFANQH
ncbi:mitochondrial carrier domain-containing protein [Halteromyces radiatus]|uniref:mitochondrial carrier domain-containing protein n=1 Tax=Halteromyces radiatus TaxID=101107 RepID=UPI002220C51F|nr:mitochondrial carrier domain-containing protein [Halteromyces radiatus]KAI8086250.1 mitochondrial carrier domain-containing protein [Halteromyces radiatus]